ncbi:MAG: SGNH/GDSL hydrolase family protein, partial [Candidatus Thiosymbion ectosymbiont of Robbea hypermnestra]|nr:SGNH/GDSL hydrolase family protein [Candidatus Thiosymbion ectosymbiont of Robbea hypermnestra]
DSQELLSVLNLFLVPDCPMVGVHLNSYAEARQVPLDKTFWHVMEQDLAGCEHLGDQVEVINFGVSSYGTAQELITLQRHVWKYSPDIVLLAFLTGNDVRNNSSVLEQDIYRPYFVYKDNELILDESYLLHSAYRKRWYAKLWHQGVIHSRILQVINETRNAINQNKQKAKMEALSVDPTVGSEMGLDNMIYREPISAVWKEAWRVTEGLISLMHDEVKNKGARFFVATLSSSIQVYPDPEVRQNFAKELGVGGLDYPDLRIKALGARKNFRF